jgi:hypothetical protein
MTESSLLRARFIWGHVLSPDGRQNDYFSYFRLDNGSFPRGTFDERNFTPINYRGVGNTLIYWGNKAYEPVNRRAINYVRPVYEANHVKFPRGGARGEALIVHGVGERYHIPVPAADTIDEVIDWAEENLVEERWFIYEDPEGQWHLILGDDESDHFKAKMRFG